MEIGKLGGDRAPAPIMRNSGGGDTYRRYMMWVKGLERSRMPRYLKGFRGCICGAICFFTSHKTRYSIFFAMGQE